MDYVESSFSETGDRDRPTSPSRTAKTGGAYEAQQQEAIEQEAREASAELINEAIQVLDSFRPTIDSPDGHISKTLGDFNQVRR